MDEYALWLSQKTLHLFNMKLEFVTKCTQWIEGTTVGRWRDHANTTYPGSWRGSQAAIAAEPAHPHADFYGHGFES